MILRAPDMCDLQAWLWRHALPLWWDVGADHVRGGFEEGIGFDGTPARLDRRLRVQARQTWVYATAHRVHPAGGWDRAARHGLTALTERFRRADGFYRPAVAADGSPGDGPVLVYDQAFVLLALAAAHQAHLVRTDVRAAAEGLVTRIVETFAHDRGGYRESAGPTSFYANPNMHLLEAFLAWEVEDPDGRWGDLADEIADLALTRFIDPGSGVLREHFDAGWRPAPGLDGRIVDVGHQFEWSWLLRRWGTLRGRADAVSAADTLFRTGKRFGIDPARGVAFNTMLDDFTPRDRNARLWPQTEWLKAAMLAARSAQPGEARDLLERQARDAAKGLSLYLATDVPGLWRDVLSPEGVFTDAYAPASSFYHIAGAIFALGDAPFAPVSGDVRE